MKASKLTDKIRNIPFIRLMFNGTFSGSGTLLSILFVIAVFVFMTFSGSKITVSDDTLCASAVLVSPIEISMSDIDEVSLRNMNDFDMGERTRGFASLFTVSGSYINDEYDLYDVYFCRSNKENYIAIRYSDVGWLLINEKSDDATQQLYEKLLSITKIS